jgi:tetratricopeptide (TPR) repeat protein
MHNFFTTSHRCQAYALALTLALGSNLYVVSHAASGSDNLSRHIKAAGSNSASSKSARKFYAGRINQDVVDADKLLAKGKYADAEDLYHKALNANSKDISARVGYGMTLTKRFKLDRGQEELDTALKQDPHNALAHCGKALIALYKIQSSSLTVQKNRPDLLKEAGDECNKALDIDATIPEAHYTLGLVYKEEGRLDKAEQAFNGALKLDPKNSDALAGLGLVKLQQNKVDEAIDKFKAAISENTGNSTAHFGLGQAFLKQNQLDGSIKELNTALYQNTNSAPVHLSLGRAYELQGNSVAAVKEYQESIRIKPENPSAYLGLSNIRESRGDMELAIAEIRSGLELSPNNPDLHQRIALDSMKVEKLDDAIKEFETTLSMSPRNTQAIDGLTNAYYLKAQKEASGAFISSNEFEKAEKMIGNAIRMNPNSLQLRLAQAKLKALAGEPVNLARAGIPTNDGERIELAEVMLAQNNFKAAADQMNTVIANAATAKDTYAVADLSLMIKDLNSAEAAYKKARTMSDNKDPQRAANGLNKVAKARDLAKQDLTLADDLAKRKQFASAVDKYHASIFANPRQAGAHYGLAEALESLYPDSPKDLREARVQLQAYQALTPAMEPKESERLEKRMAKLDLRASKIEQKLAKKQSPPNALAQR